MTTEVVVEATLIQIADKITTTKTTMLTIDRTEENNTTEEMITETTTEKAVEEEKEAEEVIEGEAIEDVVIEDEVTEEEVIEEDVAEVVMAGTIKDLEIEMTMMSHSSSKHKLLNLRVIVAAVVAV